MSEQQVAPRFQAWGFDGCRATAGRDHAVRPGQDTTLCGFSVNPRGFPTGELFDADLNYSCKRCSKAWKARWSPVKSVPPLPMRPPKRASRCTCGECQACTRREYKRRQREADPERALALKRAASRRYRKLNAEKIRLQRAAYRRANPGKMRARWAVDRAVARGELIRPDTCPECGGEERIQAHHADYSKQLEVEWLCYWCHRDRHEQEALETASELEELHD